MSRTTKRRYRKTSDRRVWVFSELNHELTPEILAKILTSAALEAARLEHDAEATHVDQAPAEPAEEQA